MSRTRIRHMEEFICQNPNCGEVFERIPSTQKPKPKFCCWDCFNETRFMTPKDPKHLKSYRRGAHRMWAAKKAKDPIWKKKEFERRVSDILEVTGR